jgi:hypothetical protein
MIEKSQLRQYTKRLLEDRSLLWLIVGIVIVGIICCVVVVANIHASDVTVYSRYTAFGEAHFYKSHWQYSLLFIVFNLIVMIGHIALMGKLQIIERRQTALLLGWMAIVILLTATVYAVSVLQLGQAA